MLSKFPQPNSELKSFGLIDKCFPRTHPNPIAARRFYMVKHVCRCGNFKKRDTRENLINAVLFADNSSGVTRLKPLH